MIIAQMAHQPRLSIQWPISASSLILTGAYHSKDPFLNLTMYEFSKDEDNANRSASVMESMAKTSLALAMSRLAASTASSPNCWAAAKTLEGNPMSGRKLS